MNRVMNCLVLVAFAVLAQPAVAGIIALGVDEDLGASWRSTSIPKYAQFDPNADNAYGNDGYYVYTGDGTTNALLSSLPAYISSVTALGVPEGGTDRPFMDDPTQAIAGTVSDVRVGMWYKNVAANSGYHSMFTITLAQPADFVLTTILDTHPATSYYDSNAIKVTGSGNASAELTGLTTNCENGKNLQDYAFFAISGNTGDVFTVSMNAVAGGIASAGVAFEHTVPEPSSLALLSIGLISLLCYAWRKRKCVPS